MSQFIRKYISQKSCWLAIILLIYSSALLAHTLHIYNWNNYLPEATAKNFESLYHCKLSQDFYGDNEEMLAKLTAGAQGYDIVVPTEFAVQALQKQKKVFAIQQNQLPNFKNLDKKYLPNIIDHKNRFSVPYAFTITLLGYNLTQLKVHGIHRQANSWALLFDPTILAKIKGKVTVLDSQRELIAAALLYLGKNPNSKKIADWIAASRVIIRAKPYWAAFNNQGYIKELAIGNIWVAMGYSSDFYQAKKHTQIMKQKFEIAFGLQKEGNILSLDSFIILTHSTHKKLAYQFINFMLDGKNAATLTNRIGLGNPNKAAIPYIYPSIIKNRAIFPTTKDMRHLYQLSDLNALLRRQLNRIWSEIKLR